MTQAELHRFIFLKTFQTVLLYSGYRDGKCGRERRRWPERGRETSFLLVHPLISILLCKFVTWFCKNAEQFPDIINNWHEIRLLHLLITVCWHLQQKKKIFLPCSCSAPWAMVLSKGSPSDRGFGAPQNPFWKEKSEFSLWLSRD